MTFRFLLFYLFLLFLTVKADTLTTITGSSIDAQADISDELSSVFNYAVKENLSAKPIGEVVAAIGKYFLSKPYASSTLEKDGEENLVINLNEFDCTTLVENVLALARAIKTGNLTEEQFKTELTFIRYRQGVINRYPSRLHYFSDWIYDNSQKNVVADISKPFGETTIKFSLNFMSTHPQLYKHLKETPEFIPVIKKQEEEINQREYYYVPEKNINEASKEINSGDLIAFTTSIKGLDISHTGIAVKDSDNKVHLLHASSAAMKVIVSDKSLSDYVKDIKKMTGIIVLRPLEPVLN